MPIYKLKLIARHEAVPGIAVFTFEKPEGLTFKPGQYGGFTLMDPAETDAAGNTRRFSLLSAPGDNHLAIAMRVHSKSTAFKRMLNQLPIGSEVKFAGPTGNFILHDDENIPAVFIAGGIGITPFYCMIKDAIKKHSTRPIYLFYGNQSQNDSAFLDELLQWAENNPNVKLIPTLVEPSDEWKGEAGYISHTMLKKYVPDLSAPIYYICGSPTMVTTLQETLLEMGIDEEKIKVEDFPGY